MRTFILLDDCGSHTWLDADTLEEALKDIPSKIHSEWDIPPEEVESEISRFRLAEEVGPLLAKYKGVEITLDD